MELRPATRVADVAADHPATIRVFQSYGIDFCCGGKRPLEEVCREMKLDFDELKKDLDLAVAGPRPDGPAWHEWSLAQVVAGIVERYHRPLDEELPRLSRMMEKVLNVHGERHPELADVSRAFVAVRDELRPHMLREEETLFPYLARVEAGAMPGDSPAATLGGPITALEHDHEVVGQGLAALRALTAGYRAPADACNTFRGLYHGFEELERNVHEHVHVENNILFPRAARLEAEIPARSPARK
jgi:regulator of cell morphogenesis and NO signaling